MAKAKQTKQNKKISEIILGNITELATGITSEKLSPIFFDATKLQRQPEPIYRLDSKNHRYYYKFGIDGEPVFYTSVTTMIRNTLPTSPYLIKWMVDKGGEAGKEEAEERAHYGTFLHIQCADLLIAGTYDLNTLSDKLTIFLTKNNILKDRVSWADELKKDVLAYAQFIIDHNVKPLAVEIILTHPDGYAGALDNVLELDWPEKGFFGEVYLSGANKGQPKETKRVIRIRAVLDVKSGRKGFYETHEIQLRAYKTMWDYHYPDLPIDKVLNWSPKDYRTTPGYNLKDQTDSKSADKLPYLVALSKIEDSKRDGSITVFSGQIDLIKGLDGNISEKTLVELVKGKRT